MALDHLSILLNLDLLMPLEYLFPYVTFPNILVEYLIMLREHGSPEEGVDQEESCTQHIVIFEVGFAVFEGAFDDGGAH